MQRNKQAIIESGVDPDLRRQRRLYAAKAAAEKKLIAAINAVEDYWAEVAAANEKQVA